jgi:hypothetical protein
MATGHPRSAASKAVARPIPRDAPVINTVSMELTLGQRLLIGRIVPPEHPYLRSIRHPCPGSSCTSANGSVRDEAFSRKGW